MSQRVRDSCEVNNSIGDEEKAMAITANDLNSKSNPILKENEELPSITPHYIEPLPRSPTDEMLSPTTRTIWAGTKRLNTPPDGKNTSNHRSGGVRSIFKQVSPIPFPYSDVDFILGTSSLSRRNIIDMMKWKYTQMSPDIDGKQ